MIASAVATAGPWATLFGVLVAGLYAILGGKLVPARTVAKLEANWEARLKEALEREQTWQKAYQVAEEGRSVTSGQVTELLVHTRAVDAFIRALPTGKGQ